MLVVVLEYLMLAVVPSAASVKFGTISWSHSVIASVAAVCWLAFSGEKPFFSS